MTPANPLFLLINGIARGTPVWVWGLLAALVVLGLTQARARTAGLSRVLATPVAMTALSVYGMVSAFGGRGLLLPVLAAWLGAAGLVVALLWRSAPRTGTHYEATTRRFFLPGSFVPLVLILGIFMTKYAVGVALALQPALARDAGFALLVTALYGVFNGLFAARTASLWRLSRRVGQVAVLAPNPAALAA